MNQERITFPLERNTLGRMKGGGGFLQIVYDILIR